MKHFSLISLMALTFSSSVFANTLPPQCQQLFDKAEVLIVEAEKQPGTHPNLVQIREKLNAGKEKIMQLNLETQLKSCDLGLAKLNHYNQNKDITN